MINLPSLLNAKSPGSPVRPRSSTDRSISIRDKLLLKEIQEAQENLPRTCHLDFPNVDALHTFHLTVSPVEGYWSGGHFHFLIEVPDGYNNVPPHVRCLTPLWHPNIDQSGKVCLSILRQSSLDPAGWSPTRRLREVIWGVDSLFGDLCDFNDALNTHAADQHDRDEPGFRRKVQTYIVQYNTKPSAK